MTTIQLGIAYQFSKDQDGDLIIEKANGAGEDSKAILLSIRDGGYGAGAVLKKPRTEMPAWHWSHIEWFDDRDGEYYRIPFEMVVEAADSGAQIASPEPLTVRHSAWPGISAREAQIEAVARQRRKIRARIKAMADKKKYEEERARLRVEEERLMNEAMSGLPSEEQMLEEMARAEFGDNWREYL